MAHQLLPFFHRSHLPLYVSRTHAPYCTSPDISAKVSAPAFVNVAHALSPPVHILCPHEQQQLALYGSCGRVSSESPRSNGAKCYRLSPTPPENTRLLVGAAVFPRSSHTRVCNELGDEVEVFRLFARFVPLFSLTERTCRCISSGPLAWPRLSKISSGYEKEHSQNSDLVSGRRG